MCASKRAIEVREEEQREREGGWVGGRMTGKRGNRELGAL